jgi:hypothetical protein
MLTAELGDSAEVTLDVDYAAKMQFPARALLADAQVVTLAKPAAPPPPPPVAPPATEPATKASE